LQQLPEVGARQLALGDGRGRPRKAPHPPAEIQDHRGKKIGRPRKDAPREVIQQKKPMNNYWARMTPEERSKEMKRRQRVSAKRGGKMIGFGVNKYTLPPKSKRAVQATIEEQKLQKRRERDRLRHHQNSN
jgi:hypothetical protein